MLSSKAAPVIVELMSAGRGSAALAILALVALVAIRCEPALSKAGVQHQLATRNTPHKQQLDSFESAPSENSIEQDPSSSSSRDQQQQQQQQQQLDGPHKLIACGTIASNHTHLIVKNPHHPEPTYVKAICETVIERSHPTINQLTIRLRRLELYRPNYDGSCVHDRFAVYTDLNVAVTPVMCGNQTGKSVTVPFGPQLTSLIVSITTSDLDHDRAWMLEIEQEGGWP